MSDEAATDNGIACAMTSTDLESRMAELETRLAFQDDAIEKLNETIVSQWALIDRHTRQIAMLNERLQDAEGKVASSANEKPPHY